MSQQEKTHKPYERARATEARLHDHIVRALQDIGLDDDTINDLMARYEEMAFEPSQPASSADLYRCDERDTPEYVPLG